MPFEELVKALAARARPEPHPALPGDAGAARGPAAGARPAGPTAARPATSGEPTRPSSTCAHASRTRRDGFAATWSTPPTCSTPDTHRADAAGTSARLLEARVARAGARAVRDLPLLTAAGAAPGARGVERHGVGLPGGDTLHQLFEAQVARTPDAVAVAFEGRALTYARAGRAAPTSSPAPARRAGVRPDALRRRVPGALAGDGRRRCSASLKAGGAYVPLDPEYPARAARVHARGRGGAVLLTQERLAGALPRGQTRAVVVPGREWAAVAREPRTGPRAARRRPDSPYVIYTSGSTGRPKGAMNAHRASSTACCWMQEAYGLDAERPRPAEDAVQLRRLGVGVLLAADVRRARSSGAARRAPGRRLPRRTLIARERITTLHFVPSMLQAFLEEPARWSRCASAAPRVLQRRGAARGRSATAFFARAAGAELHNLYGPTEAAVDVTVLGVPRAERGAVVPIGRPIANTRDLRARRAAAARCRWACRASCTSAACRLARGYLGRPELTAERFVPRPVRAAAGRAAVPHRRPRRAGSRTAPSSTSAALDYQVKMRGFRIELGEIEAALPQHPAVREAGGRRRARTARATSASWPTSWRRGRRADRRRAAGVPQASGCPSTWCRRPSSCWTRCRSRPAARSTAARCPRPERGDAARPARRSSRPRGGLERQLARIWAGVLRRRARRRRTTTSSSSAATPSSRIQIVARAQAGGAPPHAAAALPAPDGRRAGRGGGRRPALRAEQGAVTGPVPLTPIQRWLLERELPEAHHFNQALLLEPRERRRPAALERALRAAAGPPRRAPAAAVARRPRAGSSRARRRGARAAAVRWTCPPCPRPAQAAATGARRRGGAGEPRPGRRAPAARRAVRPWPGPAGPAAARHPPPRGGRRLVAHPAGGPGDRATASCPGEPVALPAKTTSFQAWARRLEAHAASGVLADGAALLAGRAACGCAAAPRDVPGGVNSQGSERVITVALDAEVTRSLLSMRRRAPRPGLDDVLLTGVASALARWTGRAPAAHRPGGPRARGAVRRRGPLAHGGVVHRAVPGASGAARTAWRPPPGSQSVRAAREHRAGQGLGYGLLRYLRIRTRPCWAFRPRSSSTTWGRSTRGRGTPRCSRWHRNPRAPRRGRVGCGATCWRWWLASLAAGSSWPGTTARRCTRVRASKPWRVAASKRWWNSRAQRRSVIRCHRSSMGCCSRCCWSPAPARTSSSEAGRSPVR